MSETKMVRIYADETSADKELFNKQQKEAHRFINTSSVRVKDLLVVLNDETFKNVMFSLAQREEDKILEMYRKIEKMRQKVELLKFAGDPKNW